MYKRLMMGLLVVLIVGLMGCSDANDAPPVPKSASEAEPQPNVRVALEYLGSDACAQCHEGAYESWQGSHHQLAMQTVSAGPILGDFDAASLKHFGENSAFATEDGVPIIKTTGADGSRGSFPVTRVFGIEPLQ